MSSESGVSGEVLRGRRGNLLSPGKSDYRKLTYHPKSASLPADHSLVDEFAGPLPVGLQLAQHVVDEFGNLVLIESISVHGLLPNRAIHQPFRRLPHEVKNNRAFAEADIFIVDLRRSPAPRFPASIRPANESRASAGVDALHRHVMPPYCYVIVHQEIRSLRVAHLPQSLR